MREWGNPLPQTFNKYIFMACNQNDIPKTDTKPSFMDRFKNWSCFCNLNPVIFLGNIFGALSDIADAIREYTDAVKEKGYAVSSLNYRIVGGATVVNGQIINEIFARSAFNNKIIGFGASMLSTANMAGGDIVSVRLYDYTSSNFCSDAILLSVAQKHGNHTDSGDAISPFNITPGHEYGVKIQITGGFNIEDVDVFIYTEPQELTY
jgi:hypothetical protein